MIMRKFEQMEQMHEAARKAKAAANAGKKAQSGKSSKAEMSDSDEEEKEEFALTEEQLVGLFDKTSYYSVNSLQRNNDCMFQKQTLDEDGFVIGIDDPNYHQLMFEVDYNAAESDMVNWMGKDEEAYIGEEDFFADDDPDEHTTKTKRGRGGGGTRRPRAMAVKKDRFAGHGIGSSSLHRAGAGGGGGSGKVKLSCHEPFYLKVPAYPIPRSWLKPISKYDARTEDQYRGVHYVERDICSLSSVKDFFYDNNGEKIYRAVLMDPPFDMSESPVHIQDPNQDTSGTVKLEDFKKIPMDKVRPPKEGCMLFIWVPSELTMQVNAVLESWGFLLVEHATWIMRNISWQIENRPSNLTGISKQNLLLYRRTKNGNANSYGKLELRHQRTSDSYFDYVRYHPETGRELKSDYHYKIIETMLPDLDQKEKGQALFLWAPKDEKRDGWTCICDTKQLAMLAKNKEDVDIGDW